MTEQVIDIRDRIEKMRNQITVPGSQTAVQKKKLEPEKEFYKGKIEEKKSDNTPKDITKTQNIDGFIVIGLGAIMWF